MSIADKLIQIAENEQRVYDTAHHKGYMAGGEEGFNSGYQQGHDAGMSEGWEVGQQVGYDSGKADGITEGIETGKTQEYWRFWNIHQMNGTRRNYPSGFAGSCWTDETYNPPYEIIVTSIASMMFYANTLITSTKVPITIDSTVNNVQVFSGCTRLETIPSLKVTEKVIGFTNWFHSCNALTNITFTEDSVIAANIDFQYSPLSKASIQSVVNALSPTVTGKTVTFKKTAKEAAFTQEEWNALVATKSNWTFSLI